MASGGDGEHPISTVDYGKGLGSDPVRQGLENSIRTGNVPRISLHVPTCPSPLIRYIFGTKSRVVKEGKKWKEGSRPKFNQLGNGRDGR